MAKINVVGQDGRKLPTGAVLLTGVAGFVGSHLAERLLRDGHRVIGVDNLITGRRENLGPLLGHERFSFVEEDAAKPLTVDEPLAWVMHFASPASPPKYLDAPVQTMLVNSLGTHQLLELARHHGARFFLASTSEVYGDPLQHPQTESYWGNVNPIGPRSVYDEAKRYAEALTMSYHREFGLGTRIIRIFNTYGPRMDPEDGRVVTNFINQALCGAPLTIYGQGEQTRSLQYIDDLVEGIVRYMGVEHPGPVNLGNPDEYTVRQIAELVLALTGSRSQLSFHPLPENDPTRRRPDISLARELLDWEPKVAARDGLSRTIHHYQEVNRRRPPQRAAQG